MTDSVIFRRKSSLKQKVLHEIAKICWGRYVLRTKIDGEFISVPLKIKELTTHLDEVLNNLPTILNALPKAFSATLPKSLLDKVVDAIIRLQQGYKEALVWERTYESVLPFTILNPITASGYQAGCFIDPIGHFDDLAWAKRFVSDKVQSYLIRFQLACFYCLEEHITHIWHIMKAKGSEHSFTEELWSIKLKYGYLVSFWVHKLENRMDELDETNEYYKHDMALWEAINEGHEYGARYFWSRCTDIERENFLKISMNNALNHAAKKDYTGIVYFFYSLLTLEQKKILIHRSVERFNERIILWSCLLDSAYYKHVLNEITTFPFNVPSNFYAVILKNLAYNRTKSQNSFHGTIFKMLWNHLLLVQRNEVFKCGLNISFLLEIMALDLVEFIIQSLSDVEKKQMMLSNWGWGGMTAIHIFSKNGDYDALHRYLLLFIFDRHQVTQKLILRADALNIFNNCIKKMFIHLCKFKIPERQKEEVSRIIDSLEGSLNILYQLRQQLEVN